MSKKHNFKPATESLPEEENIEESDAQEETQETESTESTETEEQTNPTETADASREYINTWTSGAKESESAEKDEQTRLIEELGVTPAGVNVMSGKPILPNTPMLRRMKELKDSKQTSVDKAKYNLSDVVREKYGDKAAEDTVIKYLVSTLSEYVERMHPKNYIDETGGAQQQLKLARVYDTVLNATPEVSMVGLEIIVSVFLEHNDLFNEIYASRFINVARLNSEQAYRFQLLTTLFIELAIRANQKSPAPIGESVNIQKLMDFIPDRNGKANLAEFLS